MTELNLPPGFQLEGRGTTPSFSLPPGFQLDAEATRQASYLQRLHDLTGRVDAIRNDQKASAEYVQDYWRQQGEALRRSNPRFREAPLEVAVAELLQTIPAETRESVHNKRMQEWTDVAEDRAIKEYYQRREQIGQAVWMNHRQAHPEASEQESLAAVHHYLAVQGFQPPGASRLPPLVFKDGELKTDYTIGWTELKNIVRGLPRGLSEIATAPKRFGTAIGEGISDIIHADREGADVTSSNIYRDIRKRTDLRRKQVRQFFKGEHVPYLPKDFDLWGIVGEQAPQLGITAGGAQAAMMGHRIAGNTAMVAGMFAREGASAFDTYMQYAQDKGIDPRVASDQALIGAVTYAAISSVLERFGPFELLQHRSPPAFRRMTMAAIGSFTEGGTEFSQAITQEAIAHGLDLRDFDMQSLKNSVREALAGAIVGGGVMGVIYRGPAKQTRPPDAEAPQVAGPSETIDPGETFPPMFGPTVEAPVVEAEVPAVEPTPPPVETERGTFEQWVEERGEVSMDDLQADEGLMYEYRRQYDAQPAPQVKTPGVEAPEVIKPPEVIPAVAEAVAGPPHIRSPDPQPVETVAPPAVVQSVVRDALEGPSETVIPGDGTTGVTVDLANTVRRLLSDNEGFWDPEATGRVISGGITTASEEAGTAFTGLISLTDETAILRRTPAGALAVEVVDGAVSEARLLMGRHQTNFNRAWKALPRTSRRWLETIREDGQTNWATAIEHSERITEVPPPGVREAVNAYRTTQNELGNEATRVKIPQRKKDGSLGPFEKATRGRYFRIFSPEGHEALRYQRGPTWAALLEWLQAHPDRNPDLPVDDEVALKEQLKGERKSGETKKAGSLEYTRVFAELPVYLRVNDKLVPFQEARPQNHYRSSLEAQARRIAFWDVVQDRLLVRYGKFNEKTGEVELPLSQNRELTDVDGLVDLLRHDVSVASRRNPRGTERAFNRMLDNYFRQHRGGLMEELLAVSSDSKLAQIAIIPSRNVLASILSFSGLWDIFQPTAAAHVIGLRHLAKAYAKVMIDVVAHPIEFSAEYQAIGAVMDSHQDWSVRSDKRLQDILGKNLPQAQMFLAHRMEIWSQTVTATAFSRWADQINGRLKDRQAKMLRKHLRLTEDEVLAIARGEMTPEAKAKIIQNGVKTTNYLAEDPHRRGLLRNIPMFRFLIPFTSVLNGSARAVGRTVTDITEDAQAAAKGDRRAYANLMHSTGRLMTFMVLAFGRGMLQRLLRRMITGRRLIDPLDPKKWYGIVLEALGEGAMFGPYYRIIEASKYSGGDPERFAVNLVPRIAIMLEFVTAVWGVGKYEGSEWTERLERAGLRFSPAGRTVRNWYDRFVYPQREEYRQVRRQVLRFNEERGVKPRYGTGGRNPHYYHIFEAVRDHDRAALEVSLNNYKEWAKAQNLSSEEARTRLQSSLQSRRPINLSEKNKKAFFQTLDPFKQAMAERAARDYEELLKEAIQRPGVRPRPPRPKQPKQPRRPGTGGDWYGS